MVTSPPTTRYALEDLAARVVSALEHSPGQPLTGDPSLLATLANAGLPVDDA
jgi:hypothetical protein